MSDWRTIIFNPHAPRATRHSLILLALLFWLLLAAPVWAQAPTATPDEAGVIYAIVQPNDSLWLIAGRHGLNFAELLALNPGLDANALLQPGQRLIVGYGAPPVTPTSPPTPTPTLPPPTPRPTILPPRTAVCLLAFHDPNRNGVWDAGEPLRAGVAFTVTDETTVVANYITTGTEEPYCIEGLRGGLYQVTRSVTPREVLTTDGDWRITLAVGSVAQLAFGSYEPDTATAVAPAPALNTPAPASAPAANPTPQPPVAIQNPATRFWGTAFAAMILLVSVICLLIWKQLRKSG